jgi:hypothetical protein
MDDQKPPLFPRWRSWYTLVLTALVIQIVLYYWITVSFA